MVVILFWAALCPILLFIVTTCVIDKSSHLYEALRRLLGPNGTPYSDDVIRSLFWRGFEFRPVGRLLL